MPLSNRSHDGHTSKKLTDGSGQSCSPHIVTHPAMLGYIDRLQWFHLRNCLKWKVKTRNSGFHQDKGCERSACALPCPLTIPWMAKLIELH
eukprot:scaffold136731_cov39-Prasinocladus_malaysianus.AAC.1